MLCVMWGLQQINNVWCIQLQISRESIDVQYGNVFLSRDMNAIAHYLTTLFEYIYLSDNVSNNGEINNEDLSTFFLVEG